jgi:hypothetical protein
MALNIGIRYAIAGTAQGLAEWRQQHVGAVPIRLELKDGSEIVGSLESFEPGGEQVHLHRGPVPHAAGRIQHGTDENPG